LYLYKLETGPVPGKMALLRVGVRGGEGLGYRGKKRGQ